MNAPADRSLPPGLLAGWRVLDLSVWRPGPYATQLLAEVGAEVIKVEPPGGDPMRTYPELFASLNANKASLVLDLKTEDDRTRALALCAEADIVVEGFRPGVAERLGVGYDAVAAQNPEVIYCSLSGFGQTGPLAQVPGHDLNYQAWAGVLAPEGGPPQPGALPIADLAGGLAAAFAIATAALHRLGGGGGERIDVAMTDVLATWTGSAGTRSVEAADGPRQQTPGYGTFVTAGGRYVVLGVVNEDHFWARLCHALGLSEFAALGFGERLARGDELQARVAGVLAARDRDDLVSELLAADVPVAPVLDREGMLALEHLAGRDVVVHDPWAPRATGYPVRFARRPSRRHSPPPGLGEHQGVSFAPRAGVAD
jgi:crotonobetainyl-CoA:carnitine CoA-transferase CaiB-like acyl-CoA transferase